MTCKKARTVRNLILLAGAFFCLLYYLFAPMGFVGIALWLGGLFVHLRYCRCPHCGANIGRNFGDYCQYCGKPLD